VDGNDPAVSDDLALLLPTSGSTGSPKFVRLSRRAVLANADSIAEALDIDDDERAITSLPIHYSYGLSVVNSHLRRGAQVVLTGMNVLEAGYWALIRDLAVTSMAGVPYSYLLLRRLDFEGLGVPSLRTLTQAGGRLDPKLVMYFHSLMTTRGGNFFVMYGQTEATARIAILPSDALPAKRGSVGLAVPGGAIHLLGGDGATLPPGETGEVVYAGPNVMLGYAEGPDDLALGDVQGGRLSTGDLGHCDSDGYLFITGRTKRIAKAFGYRISLDEIEAVLATRGTLAVTCIDEKVVVHCEGWTPQAMAEAKAYIARLMRLHQSAFDFRSIEQLPALPSGKVDYRKLSGG
jgi:acyl-CoA synthetase (AMP-forming)/AMP-acid ligase II